MKEENKKEEIQSRREFFKEAAKKGLPIVAAIALAGMPTISKAEGEPMGCDNSCTGHCYGSCTGTCRAACKDGCINGCKGCQWSCEGTCDKTCSGGCKSNNKHH